MFCLMSGYLSAQCTNITGPDFLSSGQSGTFTISNSAQCSSCYDWDIVSGNATITSSDQNQSVTIQSNTSSSFKVKVTYFTESGCVVSCIKECNPATSCTQPELNSYFVCDGWEQYGGHGAVYIAFPNGNTSTVQSIDWVLTNAEFVSGSLTGQSSGTTYGSGSPGNIANYNCNNIGVQATVHYNNGCSPITITETIVPSPGTGGGLKSSSVAIYPNPSKSQIEINMSSVENIKDVQVKIIDISTGKVVYTKLLDGKSKILNVSDLDKYSMLEVLFMKKQKVLFQKRVLVKQ